MKAKSYDVNSLTPKQIVSICDHTFLNRSEAYRVDAILGESPVRLREQAFRHFLEEVSDAEYPVYGVCVRPEDVAFARRYLDEFARTPVQVCAAVGFPDGSWYQTKHKAMESQLAIEGGASEIDMVVNYDALRRGDHGFVLHEVQTLCQMAHRNEVKVKVILETSELTNEEMVHGCRLANFAGADFIKTSTGYSSFGAKAEDVALLAKHFRGGIKISGGVSAQNIYTLLSAVAAQQGGQLLLDPAKIRIGESRLLGQLIQLSGKK